MGSPRTSEDDQQPNERDGTGASKGFWLRLGQMVQVHERGGGVQADERRRPSRPPLRRFAPLTTRVINPVTRLVAGRLPGFGVLTHVGRHTGRPYRTPLAVMRREDGYVVALGSGSDVNWVKNVLAAGHCQLRTRGRTVLLGEPRVWTDPTRAALPPTLRWFGSALGVTEFLRLRVIERSEGGPG